MSKYLTPSARSHAASVGVRYRSALKLLTMANTKTPKGEAMGYLTAILYLQPHTAGGGKTLCPHSTEACREMCLAGAGLSGLPKQLGAKQRRTDLFNFSPTAFIQMLWADIEKLKRIAADEGMQSVVRLNGTSDIRWERLLNMDDRGIRWMDYTKSPLEHRAPGPDYYLTYSVGGPEDIPRAIGYLRAGHSIAVVVPEIVKHGLVGLETDVGGVFAHFVDGDLSDLRFLDSPSSIVLLKPKGHIRTHLVRPDILSEIRAAVRQAAA